MSNNKSITVLSKSEHDALNEYEKAIDRGLSTFTETANALKAIKDGKLYREQYKTFQEYCQNRWGFTQQRALQLISASNVVANLEATTGSAPSTEAQARPLGSVPEEDRAKAWGDALKASGGKSPTGKQVAKAAEKYKPPKVIDVKNTAPVERSQSSKTELRAIPTPTATESSAVPEPVPTPDLSSSPVLKLLTLFDVEVGENAGAWLVAAYSPDEAQTLVATDQLIPFADLKCKLYEMEYITISVSGTPHILFGGMWRKVEAPRPAERPMAKPTVNYPAASSPAPRAVGMPERPFFPSPKNLHNERVARKEGAAPERKQARHDEEFES